MRLVHLSDLHLGFRQYQRLTPAGINQREADVAAAFRRAIDRTIELRPDVVLVAGDVFHMVRPSNSAILHAFMQLARLQRGLPDADVVMIAGNHDTPKSTETGGILRLFAQLGVHVVDGESRRLHFPDKELAILAVPDTMHPHPSLAPEPGVRWNVLLLHGEVEGMLPDFARQVDRAVVEISKEELGAPHWSYVALGHFHVYREIAPNAFYAGSIEYTSSNPWDELQEERAAGVAGKGFIERDLATGAHRFHHLEPARRLIDLPRLSARGMAVAELDAAIRAAVEAAPGGLDENIVRLVVRDVPRHVNRELDHKALRELKRRALHFQLDTRRPEVIRQSAHGAPGRRPSLADVVREQLQSRLLPSDIDRERLVTLGLEYLRAAETDAAAEPSGGLA